MAQRRMYSMDIVGSDAFLDMPASARLLYYDLGMRADDDGFINNAKSIMRTTGASDDDIKLLVLKKFIIPFESGIVVVKHWNINNYIQKDRYHGTKYKEEKAALQVDENGAYTTSKTIAQIGINIKKPLTTARVKRLQAHKQSDLPYSFEYKIRNAFVGEPCPVCGIIMGHTEFSDRLYFPTIQHNIPISKGGTHDLENISVICRSCNSTIQDKETPPYNTEKVKEIWHRIGNVSGMDTQVRLGKDRLGKVRQGKNTVPCETIVERFNTICQSLSKVVSLTDKRKDKIKKRWEELKTVEAFENLFYITEESDFLCGRGKEWKCSFDWLMLNDTNYVKVLEGNYANKKPPEDPFTKIMREEMQNEQNRINGSYENNQPKLPELL